MSIVLLSFIVIKNKYLGATLLAIGYFLGIAEFLAYTLAGEHLDLFTILRLDTGMLLMVFEVADSLIYSVFVLTICITILVTIRIYENDEEYKNRIEEMMLVRLFKRINSKPYLTIAIVSFFILINTNTSNVILEISKEGLYYLKYAALSEEEIFNELGANKKYMRISDVISKKGKNLVIIYCESLETAYMSDALFPGLMPHANKMAEKSFRLYENYSSLYGTSWTIGALYATQTGLPCIFGQKKDFSINRFDDSRVVTFAKVLKNAGYSNLFLSSSDLEFCGTGKFMQMLGYDIKNIKEFNKVGEKTAWGVHDLDLFEQAKIEYKKLLNNKKPFNLTLLTIDTHFPNGIPDPRIKHKIKIPIDNELEYCVASLDYLLEDFYNFIKSQPRSQDTVLVIIGDHPLMGDSMQKKFADAPRRMVLMTSGYDIKYDRNDPIYYYDIPEMILRTIGVKHNAIFPKDLFDKDYDKIVSDNHAAFASINLKLNR